MSNILPSLPSVNTSAASTTTASSASAANSAKATTAALIQSFEQLLTASMLSSEPTSSLFSGNSSSDSSSDPSSAASLLSGGSSASDPSTMMLPMMISLIEQLLSQQVSQDSSTTTAAAAAAPVTPKPINSVSSQATTQTVAAKTYNDAGVSAIMPSGRPVGGVLTQGFHSGHTGLDLGVPIGTSVKSTMNGKVVYAGWNTQGYGNLVIVENGPYRTYYGHLSSIPVKVGQQISAGNEIGLSGSTGNSTGPHLHYEIRRNMVPIDPTRVTLG